MRTFAGAIVLLLAALPAAAQLSPRPGGGDPRLQMVDYDPSQIVQLRGQPGYQVTVELAPDEQVENVAVGDNSSWQVSVNRERNRLFIKPQNSAQQTNMTVITSARIYNFELAPADGGFGDAPYNVRFQFPDRGSPKALGASAYVDVASARRRHSRYKLSGDRLLRPSGVSDDGQRTFISWPRNLDLPATYEIAPTGQEMIVDGMMRDDILIIDRLVSKLRFRRDNKVAHAVRLPPRKKTR